MTASLKECYCHTCQKWFHWLGITRHRAAHRDRAENCRITFTHGDTYRYNYAESARECKHCGLVRAWEVEFCPTTCCKSRRRRGDNT